MSLNIFTLLALYERNCRCVLHVAFGEGWHVDAVALSARAMQVNRHCTG